MTNKIVTINIHINAMNASAHMGAAAAASKALENGLLESFTPAGLAESEYAGEITPIEFTSASREAKVESGKVKIRYYRNLYGAWNCIILIVGKSNKTFHDQLYRWDDGGWIRIPMNKRSLIDKAWKRAGFWSNVLHPLTIAEMDSSVSKSGRVGQINWVFGSVVDDEEFNSGYREMMTMIDPRPRTLPEFSLDELQVEDEPAEPSVEMMSGHMMYIAEDYAVPVEYATRDLIEWAQ